MPIDPADFRRACGKFATGIAVLTARDRQGAPYGMTANSFTSVSLDPPLVLVCVDFRSRILEHLREGAAFAVNVLREDQEEISVRFAQSVDDRFDGVEWREGEKSAAPLLAAVLATIECVASRLVEAGDHAIVIGEVQRAAWGEGRPLLYFSSAYRKLDTPEE